MNADNKMLSVKNLVKHFDISGGFLDQIRFKKGKICLEKITVKAVNDVSLSIKKGETLSGIAEKYRVGLSKVRYWNNIYGRKVIYPGQKLSIYQ